MQNCKFFVCRVATHSVSDFLFETTHMVHCRHENVYSMPCCQPQHAGSPAAVMPPHIFFFTHTHPEVLLLYMFCTCFALALSRLATGVIKSVCLWVYFYFARRTTCGLKPPPHLRFFPQFFHQFPTHH